MKHRFFWHRKRTLSNFTVIAIDQVGNGFDHAVLLVLRHFGHKTKIKNGKLSIGSSHHVTRVLKDERKEVYCEYTVHWYWDTRCPLL
jgi:hypothetical protein